MKRTIVAPRGQLKPVMGYFKYFLFLIILSLSNGIIFVSCGDQEMITENPNDPENPHTGFDFPQGKIFFHIPPLDISGIIAFEPMGYFDTFPQDHGGFHHNQIGVSHPTLEVYALADGMIRALGKSGADNWIQIQYSTTISVKLGHIGDLADFIISKTGELIDGKEMIIDIEVTEGQVIGYVSGFSALDIGIHDEKSEKNFCYPELFYPETTLAASLFDYYQEPLRSQLIEKAMRNEEPKGGKVDFDVKETISGNWFREGGEEHDPKNHFAVGYSHIFPHRIALFDGYAKYSGEIQDTYSFSWIKYNNPLPESVDLSYGPVKYELIHDRSFGIINNEGIELNTLDGVDEQISRGVMMLEMLAAERMQVEFFPQKTPEEVTGFSGNQQIYIRNPR